MFHVLFTQEEGAECGKSSIIQDIEKLVLADRFLKTVDWTTV